MLIAPVMWCPFQLLQQLTRLALGTKLHFGGVVGGFQSELGGVTACDAGLVSPPLLSGLRSNCCSNSPALRSAHVISSLLLSFGDSLTVLRFLSGRVLTVSTNQQSVSVGRSVFHQSY